MTLKSRLALYSLLAPAQTDFLAFLAPALSRFVGFERDSKLPTAYCELEWHLTLPTAAISPNLTFFDIVT